MINLSDLEKQLQEIQKMDMSTLSPEQLQEIINKLSNITDMGEEILSDDIQKLEENNLNEEDDFDNYLSDINNEENESYDETDNS
jgi:hypothetical protein